MKKIICSTMIVLISCLIGYKVYRKKTKYIKVNPRDKNPYNYINKKPSNVSYYIIDMIISCFKKSKNFNICESKKTKIKPKCSNPANCKKCIFKKRYVK